MHPHLAIIIKKTEENSASLISGANSTADQSQPRELLWDQTPATCLHTWYNNKTKSISHRTNKIIHQGYLKFDAPSFYTHGITFSKGSGDKLTRLLQFTSIMHIVSASGDGEKPAAFHLKDSSLLIKWTPAEAAGLMSCRLAYLISPHLGLGPPKG
jgi:hypothetical protein